MLTSTGHNQQENSVRSAIISAFTGSGLAYWVQAKYALNYFLHLCIRANLFLVRKTKRLCPSVGYSSNNVTKMFFLFPLVSYTCSNVTKMFFLFLLVGQNNDKHLFSVLIA